MFKVEFQMNILAAVRHPGPAEAMVPVIRLLRSQGHQVSLIALDNNSIETKTLGGSAAIFIKNKIQYIDMLDFDPSCDLRDVDSECTNNLIDRYKPDRILVGCSTQEGKLIKCIENSLIIAGSNHSITTLQLVEMWGCWSSRHESLYPDRFAVLDEFTKNVVLKMGGPKERIKITGNPSFDAFYHDNPNGCIQNKCTSVGNRNFVYIGQVSPDNFTTLGWAIKSLGANDKVAFLKHPRDLRNYDDLLAKAGDKLWATDLTGGDLLKQADICLTHSSTMGIKAALSGVPTVNFMLDNDLVEVRTICKGFPLVLAGGSYKADSLEVFQRLLKQELVVDLSKLRSILNIDGRSAYRVVEYLLS